jgi:hypothetical protein
MDDFVDDAPISMDGETLDKTPHRALWDRLWKCEQQELEEFEILEIATLKESAGPMKQVRPLGLKSDSAIELVSLPEARETEESPQYIQESHRSTSIDEPELAQNESENVREEEDRESPNNNPLFDESTFVIL